MNADCDSAKMDNSAGEPGALPGAPRNPPGFQRSDWLSFGDDTAGAVGLSSDARSRSELGIFRNLFHCGHVRRRTASPGYPLWVLWAGFFTKLLPFSNIAWRAAVSSAVASALSAFDCIDGVAWQQGHWEQMPIIKGEAKGGEMAPDNMWVCCRNGFWVNGAFWPQAVIVAVWPLSILLLCIVLCLLMCWSSQPELNDTFMPPPWFMGCC